MNKLKHINKMASLYRYATLLSNINHNLFVCILVSLVLPTCERASAKVHDGQPKFDGGERRLSKEYHLRQGALRGLIVQPGRQYELQSVEMFLGIPYAAPPVGNLRFMPPGSALPWSGVKMATQFAPVCPQMLPNIKKENPPSSGRQQYINRLLPFLQNESEDCLYLNIYAPYQEHKTKKLPVLVFIHGDSFEWSSGNPYDGRILASYGNVMVITINFRLGILGFMKPSLTEHVYGNNGLLDQLAALQWIKDNIADLNGDPNSVTLMGHGTGAACVNYLMISPIANGYANYIGLFHRAILMSGSALSDWALTKNPEKYTVQVAQDLHCNMSNKNIMGCLQNKRLSDIKKIQILARKYETPLGPIVAGSFIPNEPEIMIQSYPNILSKYDLLSGVTELESYHDFGVIALAHGVLETERDEILQQFVQLLYDASPEIAVREILQEYSPMRIDPQRWGVNANRDFILDVLSDARTVAPAVHTANYHSNANPKSYFYVFGHNSEHTDYAALRKSVHGEEVPYVLGVPLGGANTHFHEEYTAKERLLSEAVMRLWTNFVKGGTPNTQRIEQYLTLNQEDWNHYNIEWPEYNVQHQSFLHIDVPQSNFVRSFYRANYTKFWNEALPKIMKNYTVSPLFEYEPVAVKPRKTYTNAANTGWRHSKVDTTPIRPSTRPQVSAPTYGKPRQQYVPPPPAYEREDIYKEIKAIKTPVRTLPSGLMENPIKKWTSHTTTISPVDLEPVKSSTTFSIIIGIGCVFLIVNIVIFATLYLKKRRLQVRVREFKRENPSNEDNLESDDFSKLKQKTRFEKFKSRCTALKTNWNKISINEKKPNTTKLESCKTPISDDSGGFGQRFKLRRHLSSSTIDAHTKVRDWIANEIINRCSPPITRKSNFNIEMDSRKPICSQKQYTKSDEVINKPTKHKTKSKESINILLHGESNSILSTQRTKNKNLHTKTSEKTTSTSAHGSHLSINNSKDIITKPYKSVTSKSNTSISNSEENKANKVSVAIDATPAARTSAILRQQPIELSKSVDIVDRIIDAELDSKLLRRSKTENDFTNHAITDNSSILNEIQDTHTFTSVVNLSVNEEIGPKTGTNIVKSFHKHSASDPVKNINYDAIIQYTDFPDIPPPSIFRNDINVTSKDETKLVTPMTAAEALLTIQRRNYPKVLPDLPKSFTNQKRFSLQPNSFQTFKSYINNESNQKDASPSKTPPVPPPRTTSTLDRRLGFKNSKHSATSSFDSGKSSFGSISENRRINPEDYCNIDVLSSLFPPRNNSSYQPKSNENICDSGVELRTQPVIRELPKAIITANDIASVHGPRVIIKPTLEQSLAEIHANAPRVRLPDTFHTTSVAESERSGSSLSMILDSECDPNEDFEEDFLDEKLLQELVGGIDTVDMFDIKNMPDTKGPDNSFEKKLEIVPVKIHANPIPSKNYDDYIYCSDDILPDVSDLEKTAQIKQKFSLSKLQNRSESINKPPEKAVKLRDKKSSKAPIFLAKTNKDKLNCTVMAKLPKQKTEKKKVPLEHSNSGSSNDTESSTGTVKKVELKK